MAATAPLMEVRAHYLHVEEGVAIDDVRDELTNLQGKKPSKKCVWNGVKRVAEVLEDPAKKLLPTTKYGNCGRQKLLTDERRLAVVGYVGKWRGKRFGTWGKSVGPDGAGHSLC